MIWILSIIYLLFFSAKIHGLQDINQNEEEIFPRQRVKRAFTAYRTGKELSNQVSEALNFLLVHSAYDKRLRPQFGGLPVSVVVNLSIRSMGPVDESRQVFSLDCYFRQSWVDDRLKYNATGVTELALNWAFLAKIWVPDTFFVNGKKSYLHKITVPNRFVRISPSGRVSYSQRLTIWADCQMNLRKFPLDSQICPLVVGSFGYSSEDIIYEWAKPTAVSIDKLGLAQFHLVNYDYGDRISISDRRIRDQFRNDSVVYLNFQFERQTGFFLLQIYTPLTLIVFCSWVAFWLVKTEKGGEVPARTVLGANSVLSIVNIGFTGKGRPKVGYATALDVFIILCLITVFAALVEFACINFIDKFFKWRKAKEELEKKEKKEEREEEEEEEENENSIHTIEEEEEIKNSQQQESPHLKIFLILHNIKIRIFKKCDFLLEMLSSKPVTELYVYQNTLEVIYSIDSFSRKVFPIVFFILQIFYWTSYLYLF